MCLPGDDDERRSRMRVPLALTVTLLAGVSCVPGRMHLGTDADLMDLIRGIMVGIALGMILFTSTPRARRPRSG